MLPIKHHRIIIIGSGPAGLTAGIYAARANMQPLIFEGASPGGQLMGTAIVENWPGVEQIIGGQLIANIKSHAEYFGATCTMEEIKNINLKVKPFILISDNTETSYSCDALILATGASHKKLGCPGEEKYWGHGVTTCAVCDGALYKDQPVVVVGGGNAGAENVLFMTKFTKNITLVHRSSELAATPILKDRILANKNITIIFDSTVTEIIGDNERVTQVKITNSKTGKETIQPTACVLISVGTKSNTDLVAKQLEMDSAGYIITKNFGVCTSIPGVFVAGDIANQYHRQAIVSSGFGCIAALEAEKYLLHN